MADDESDLGDFEDFEVDRSYREPGRKRGIFTEKDRQYLLGELEIDGQDERNLRYRMRQRVIESFRDLLLLESEYPDEELEKVVENAEFSNRRIIKNLVKLSYRTTRLTSENAATEFEDAIEKVVTWESREHRYEDGEFITQGANIDLDLSIEPYELTLKQAVHHHLVEESSAALWESLNNWVAVHYHHLVPEEELEGSESVEVHLPGVDAPMTVHPILAEKIDEVKQELN